MRFWKCSVRYYQIISHKNEIFIRCPGRCLLVAIRLLSMFQVNQAVDLSMLVEKLQDEQRLVAKSSKQIKECGVSGERDIEYYSTSFIFF